MDDSEVKFCSNCKHQVPAANFIVHHVHCQRKLAFCQKCNEPIPHSELAAHNINVHAIISCPDCGHKMEKRCLQEHKTSVCSHRAICCNFCHIEVQANEIMDHENYCGSRTERCDECGEFVMLKYQQIHQDTNHGFLKLSDEPGPMPSWSTSNSSASVLNDLGRQRKISNASQDTSRPTSALNRLSPSKRTNDMPQVNSVANISKPKALHKPTLPQGNMFEDDAIDLDRLLALRLQEQENTRTSTPTAPPDTEFGDSDDPGGELVALPCEFCEAMIPANQLVIHETGCRPDLAQYSPPTTKSKSTPEPDEDGLPCEFCGELFAPEHLLQHEAACEGLTTSTQEKMHVNMLGLTQPNQWGIKKIVNMEPSSSPYLFPRRRSSGDSQDEDDKNQYLIEIKAALKKTNPNSAISVGSRQSANADYSASSASVPNHHMDVPSCINGFTRHTGSTGAVPKQKAGKHIGIREVSQEVPRSSASSITSMNHPGLDHGDSSR